MLAISAALLLGLASVAPGVQAHCPRFCNGHGRCVGVNRCQCFSKWGGGDCSIRLCPAAESWNDIATADDTAHARATCSDRGICIEESGVCECNEPFEGTGCQRMKCPDDCGGRGRCRSMTTLNKFRDAGLATFAYTGRWDAEKIHGCECDSGFAGFACQQRVCPIGDDPMTQGQVDEVQLFRCDMDSTSDQKFVLRFRKATTRAFGASATEAEVQKALDALPTTDNVQVKFLSALGSTTSFCFRASVNGPSDNVVQFTFQGDPGDLPRLLLLDGSGAELPASAAASIHTAVDGESLTRHGGSAIVSVKGTKEALPCSGRGHCDEGSGACQCYTGFASSDGRGASGSRPDCGFAAMPITSCPGKSIECSGHGKCSGHPEYGCTCDRGWTGGDCADRLCPTGRAWMDLAYTANAAHAQAECSNRGICDRETGKCNCQAGFTGEGCEKLACPGTTADGRTCSGHGTCHSMEGLAQLARTNGVSTPFTYGQDRNSPATWDFRSSQGCICFDGWEGFDCSLRACPTGDDPTTSDQFDEVQSLVCSHVSGAPAFSLRFRDETTSPIAATASAAEVKAALEQLDAIGTLAVSFGPTASQACSSAGTTITFSFQTENGDLPPIEVVESDSISNGDLVMPALLKATEVTKGTTEVLECSARGLCNRVTGNCECFLGFGSSDGSGGPGDRGDCGYREPYSPQRIDTAGKLARDEMAHAWGEANQHGEY
ncbi:hypothetical protein FNF27_02895 [Cafeteria roenbergensis]|uniref:EGF-like domain-containing protein n=1 Tax=Cafeteria roenbergensis TaxID=33653 RepID=A0A5A8EE26_CAFRO|nr:hypothetical protein FNF27_02895 [Cafeteria roenbergensis]